jgi:hypothetical protein
MSAAQTPSAGAPLLPTPSPSGTLAISAMVVSVQLVLDGDGLAVLTRSELGATLAASLASAADAALNSTRAAPGAVAVATSALISTVSRFNSTMNATAVHAAFSSGRGFNVSVFAADPTTAAVGAWVAPQVAARRAAVLPACAAVPLSANASSTNVTVAVVDITVPGAALAAAAITETRSLEALLSQSAGAWASGGSGASFLSAYESCTGVATAVFLGVVSAAVPTALPAPASMVSDRDGAIGGTAVGAFAALLGCAAVATAICARRCRAPRRAGGNPAAPRSLWASEVYADEGCARADSKSIVGDGVAFQRARAWVGSEDVNEAGGARLGGGGGGGVAASPSPVAATQSRSSLSPPPAPQPPRAPIVPARAAAATVSVLAGARAELRLHHVDSFHTHTSGAGAPRSPPQPWRSSPWVQRQGLRH